MEIMITYIRKFIENGTPPVAEKNRKGDCGTVFSGPYKLPWREYVPSPKNGFSMTEIVLVFAIFASILVGVWALYIVLGDETRAQTAVVEIQLLQKASVKYKRVPGQRNTYAGFTNIADLGPYLGQHQLGDGVNIFGEDIDVDPRPDHLDLHVQYPGAPSIGICQQILENFGTVTDSGGGTLAISPGDTISGYIGGSHTETGCMQVSGSDVYIMAIIID